MQQLIRYLPIYELYSVLASSELKKRPLISGYWYNEDWGCNLSTFDFIYLLLISGKVTTSIDLNLTELIHYDKGNVAV